MKPITYKDQYEILQRAFLTHKDVSNLTGMCEANARKVINEIRNDLMNEGYILFDTKPFAVPTDRVIKKLKLNYREIERKGKV